jgi:hypothetical protein
VELGQAAPADVRRGGNIAYLDVDEYSEVRRSFKSLERL